MRKIQAAIVGTGMMGKLHAEAIRRLFNVEIAAIAGETEEFAASLGRQTGVERTTGDYRTVLADPSIEVVHVCTPNALHYPITKAALLAGKHVICEKPLAISSAEALDLLQTARAKGVAHAVDHNLRAYPVVQQLRQMVAAGELGEILIAQGTYSQDWLLYDTDYNWRIDAKDNGAMRAMGDIGSHWMDMVQHVTGLRISSVCGNLETFHKTRKKPRVAIETFAGKTLRPDDYDEVPISTEDFGSVQFELGGRARGAFTVSQVSAGCKNRFQIEIFGTKAGAIWNQERPNELWIGHRNDPSQLILKDPGLMPAAARGYADLPGGHAEGYADTLKQNFRRFYATVADRSAAVDYATFEDGYRMMLTLERILESSKKRAWVDVDPNPAGASA